MTKEQILQKHFTAEFGHDGHGKFMQYILEAMEEYAQQQVKNLNIPAVIKSVCPECKGKGWTIPTDRVPYDCEKCNGTGQTVL